MKGLFRGSRYDLKTRFSLLGGHVVVTPLHFVVNGIQRRTYVVQKGVYPPGIPAFGFARSNAPVVGLDALFRTELAKFASMVMRAIIITSPFFFSEPFFK